jgi:predicted lipase
MINYILTESSKHSTKKIKLTGHSSGAANVMLLAYDIARTGAVGLEDFTVSSLFTFGEPRVGNTAFANSVISLEIPHTRVVHYRDIVPHVPPHTFGFHHSPQEIWYDVEDSSHYVECSETDGEDASCSYSDWFFDASDHCTYIAVSICSAGC